MYWVDDGLLFSLVMEEKPNIGTHESLIPQAFKKKTLRHVTMLDVYLVQNHRKAIHFLLKKKTLLKKKKNCKKNSPKSDIKPFFGGGYCHIYAYWL